MSIRPFSETPPRSTLMLLHAVNHIRVYVGIGLLQGGDVRRAERGVRPLNFRNDHVLFDAAGIQCLDIIDRDRRISSLVCGRRGGSLPGRRLLRGRRLRLLLLLINLVVVLNGLVRRGIIGGEPGPLLLIDAADDRAGGRPAGGSDRRAQPGAPRGSAYNRTQPGAKKSAVGRSLARCVAASSRGQRGGRKQYCDGFFGKLHNISRFRFLGFSQ